MHKLMAGLSLLFCLASLDARAAPDDRLPPIATIDFFGLDRISEVDARAALPFKEGDRLVKSPDLKDGDPTARKLGLNQATFAFVCCVDGQKMMAYVGIAEKPVAPIAYNAEPTGGARLPTELISTHDRYIEEIITAVNKGLAAEDDSQGHALVAYPPARQMQEEFLKFAGKYPEWVAEVLRGSADVQHRIVAATVAGYLPDKRMAARVLARAAFDANETVRNNSVRALGVIARYVQQQQRRDINIDPIPFIALLNSMTWTDRNKGMSVIEPLSTGRDPNLLKLLDQNAGASLRDMCRWKNWGHAMQGCAVLRRVRGLPENWDEASRAETLAAKAGADGTEPP